jgi:N-acylneuraminate cytidylyltransferase
MSNVAIITARGGSKRIPGKNTRDFLGNPIIAYSIETALESALFHDVIVSTDDEEIARLAEKYGASVPFMRSKKNSDDFAGTDDVLFEVLNQLLAAGKKYQCACCIYPTAPFIDSSSLRKGLDLLTAESYDSVFPVCAFSYPVQRSLVLQPGGRVQMKWPENLHQRSQDLEPCYHDAGQFYWVNVEKFLTDKNLFTNNTGAIVLNELEVQDIDNETDWKVAEMKYQLLKENREQL